MKIEIISRAKYKIINVHEFKDADIDELELIIMSFGCFYPWYFSVHNNGVSKVIYNFGGYLSKESSKIEIYNKYDFNL